MTNIFFMVSGYVLTLIGCTYVISYLNLLQMGYNKSEYVNFIIRRVECWYLLIGIIILVITILLSKGDE